MSGRPRPSMGRRGRLFVCSLCGRCALSGLPSPSRRAQGTRVSGLPRSSRGLPPEKGEGGPEVGHIPSLLPQECSPSCGGAWAPAGPRSQKGKPEGKAAALLGSEGPGKGHPQAGASGLEGPLPSPSGPCRLSLLGRGPDPFPGSCLGRGALPGEIFKGAKLLGSGNPPAHF